VSGQRVFLGGASDRYLYEADAERPWKVVRRIGPLEAGGVAGVRPFTIDAQDTLAFTTATRYLGFQVSDVATGRVLYTVPVPGFGVPATFRGIPSHGIGLSPDQRFLWLVDKPNRAVHEFDISGLPRRAPVMVATVHISGPNLGWLNLSRDGRYLFAGDAGNVIDTRTRTTVARMAALANSRYNIEIDWAGPRVCAAYPRESLGYLDVAPHCGAAAG
jgi:sugar lactone lactonase YvrE